MKYVCERTVTFLASVQATKATAIHVCTWVQTLITSSAGPLSTKLTLHTYNGSSRTQSVRQLDSSLYADMTD